MRPKILIIILLSSLLLGCRTKQKAVATTKHDRTEIESVKYDSVKELNSKEEMKKVVDNTVQDKKDEFSGDILIKGKSDILNPLEFHQIINGDTLQSISINGNADYIINNRFQKKDNKKVEFGKQKTTNIIQQAARDLVSKETINDVAETVTETTKKIKVNGFEAGAWIFITILGITLIMIFFTYKYFKK